MGQVTIYVDDDSEQRLKAAAKSAGMSVSRWVSKALQEKSRTEWPESVRGLAGAWPDLQDLAEIRSGYGQDKKREAL